MPTLHITFIKVKFPILNPMKFQAGIPKIYQEANFKVIGFKIVDGLCQVGIF